MTTPKESSELQDIINIRDGGTAVNENLKPVKSSNSSTSTHKENIPTLGIKKQNPSIPEVKTTDNKESKSEKGEPGDGDDDKEEDEDEEEDEYVVEKIIKKRTVDGNVEYLIKWKDWPSSTNTWEPQQHLHCPDKVQEFEQKLLEAKASAAANAPRKKQKEFSLPQSEIGYGFERGLEPEKILAATDTGGALKFVIKWKGRAKPDIVLAAEANQKCPQTVIQFYEDRLTWTAASVRTMSEELASGSGSTNGENDDSASQGSSSGPMDQ